MVMPERIGLVTADELLRLSSRGRYELVKGELIEMSPAGTEHGFIGMRLAWRLAAFVESRNLGVVLLAETGFQLSSDPDTVRAPDVAFLRAERWPKKPPKGYLTLAPDLVVEVVSPNDEPDAVQAKIAEWLNAGVVAALVVYPGSRQIAVYRSLRQVTILTDDDALELPDLLPGFTCPVSDIFA